MGESVEQAALRRAAEPRADWKGRAEREAAAILAEVGMFSGDYIPRDAQYPTVVTLMAIAWLQGSNFGSHETLAHLEDSFAELRAAL